MITHVPVVLIIINLTCLLFRLFHFFLPRLVIYRQHECFFLLWLLMSSWIGTPYCFLLFPWLSNYFSNFFDYFRLLNVIKILDFLLIHLFSIVVLLIIYKPFSFKEIWFSIRRVVFQLSSRSLPFLFLLIVSMQFVHKYFDLY